MLQIYKGEANRSHENTFFRYFATKLVALFERNSMDGVLFGMPKSLIWDDLQIDALLITKNTITIIDFKDYAGEVILPNEDLFKYGRWETSSGIHVKGGSSVNPFTQLGKQRYKLIQVFEKTLDRNIRVSNKNISTMVCFCNPVSIIGNIPASFKLSFFIADKNNFSNTLLDIIDVVESDTNLLEDCFILYLKEQIFEAREYNLTTSVDNEYSLPEDELLFPKEATEDIIVNSVVEAEHIAKFLQSDSRVMIVTGTLGSRKEDIIPFVRDAAHEEGYRDVKILALSNRVKNNLLRTQEDVVSLYSTIYDFISIIEEGEASIRKEIPLRQIDYYHAESDSPTRRETLFVVVESQMISDTYRDDPLIQFGSGKLLSDLIHHLKLADDNCPNKIIFIGDRYQLSFGSWDESCLNPAIYNKWNLKVDVLDFPDPEQPTEIQEVCIQIADAIRSNNYSNLHINQGDNLSIVAREKEEEIIKQTTEKPSSKILVYTNKQARDINLYIKNKIVNNGKQLAVSDMVIFDNQIDAYSPAMAQVDSNYPFDSISQPFDFTEPKRVENGWFGKVIAIFENDVIESDGDCKDDNGNLIKLRFVKAIVRLQEDKTIIETYILEDFLYSEQTRMGESQEREYQIFLRKLITEYMEKNPFERSQHFAEMISDEQNYKKNENGQYRDPEDGRKLTRYEKEYRKEIRNCLLRDSGTRYFKIYNAARIKFGWCLTVHRAMSYEWSSVAFATNCGDRGRTNTDYFKFIYTGISRAKHQVNLIRWRPITPFEKTEFGEAVNAPRKKDFLLEGNGSAHNAPALLHEHLLRALNHTDIQIIDTNSKNYQELITFVDSKGKEAALSFYYKGTGQISYPSPANGDGELFEQIKRILHKSKAENGQSIVQSPLYKFYCDLQLILHGATIALTKSAEYQDIIQVSIDNEIVSIQIWHTKELMISKFNYLEGNKLVFDKIVTRIGEYYGI